MKIGVCGTAFWAEQVHLPGLMAHDGLDVVGIWGRNKERSNALAGPLGLTAFASFEALLDAVDIVSFAVPPSVQAKLAPVAISRGKHVLLEKPLGPSIDTALTILRALQAQGVVGLCFLTRMFVGDMTDFIQQARSTDPDRGTASFRSDALLDGPYAGSAWRQEEHGALWDAAPHGLSVLVSVLGPVARVAVRSAPDGSYLFACDHAGGADSTFDLNLRDPSVKLAESYRFAGASAAALPALPYDRKQTLRAAADVLLGCIGGAGDTDNLQLDLALHLVCVATAAQHSLSAGGAPVQVQTAQV